MLKNINKSVLKTNMVWILVLLGVLTAITGALELNKGIAAIDEHQTALERLNAENSTLKLEIDALKAQRGL